MRAVIAHDSAVEGLRTWELIEVDYYWRHRDYGRCVCGTWASKPSVGTMSFPLDFVQVVA